MLNIWSNKQSAGGAQQVGQHLWEERKEINCRCFWLRPCIRTEREDSQYKEESGSGEMRGSR